MKGEAKNEEVETQTKGPPSGQVRVAGLKVTERRLVDRIRSHGNFEIWTGQGSIRIPKSRTVQDESGLTVLLKVPDSQPEGRGEIGPIKFTIGNVTPSPAKDQRSRYLEGREPEKIAIAQCPPGLRHLLRLHTKPW